MTRIFIKIWLTALALATACILLILSAGDGQDSQYPGDYPSVENVGAVLIGSSLAGHALPGPEPSNGVLNDGRSCAIFSVPAISEQLSTRLLAHAIDSGVETIFLEINAYAHEYVTINEPLILRSMVLGIQNTGFRLAINAKTLLGLQPPPNKNTDCGAAKADQTLDTRQLAPQDFYRFHHTEPAFGDVLRSVLASASKANVEVFFFSPPRPQSAVDAIGVDEFDDLNAHLDQMANSYGVPIWYSPLPWPDDHFMDILAHTNARGRARFQQELAEWYRARQ